MNRYWKTPPDLYRRLNEEFNFDFDPCPFPRPDDFNSLKMLWGDSNFVNPPFNSVDTFGGGGPTAFAHKAIEQQAYGKSSVLLLPVRHYINLLMEAGAEYRSVGRVRWLDVDTDEPWKSPSPIGCFILPGKK